MSQQAPPFFNKPFLICTMLLGVTALGLQPLARLVRVSTEKVAAQLRKPLSQLDERRLGKYHLVKSHQLESSVVETLGTDQYINWVLENTKLDSPDDPRRYARVSVTYYPGNTERHLHTPDICLAASGYEADSQDYVTLTIPTLKGDKEVTVRVLTFVKTGIFNSASMTVIYTFHANGKFAARRGEIIRAITNPYDSQAYYSKVEVTVGTVTFPTREEAIEETREILSRILPLLIEEHWPDWKAIKEAELEAEQEAELEDDQEAL